MQGKEVQLIFCFNGLSYAWSPNWGLLVTGLSAKQYTDFSCHPELVGRGLYVTQFRGAVIVPSLPYPLACAGQGRARTLPLISG